MSKVNIDTNGLKEDFNYSINYEINSLNRALDICKNLDIPDGFSYNSFLKKIEKDLLLIKNNSIIIKDYINNTINNIDNIIIEKNKLDRIINK